MIKLSVIKKYLILVRAYSVVDVFLLFIAARVCALGNQPYDLRDLIAGVLPILLWGLLTLSLEAKHKHSYREKISYIVPITFALVASFIAFFFNNLSFIFVVLTAIFTNFYIKKETNFFWGSTSSLWRGFYQAALFLFCLSLYKNLMFFSFKEILFSLVILLFHLSRNLIADVRDVAFDNFTLVVRLGIKESYLISFVTFFVGSLILLVIFPNSLVAIPGLTISLILLFHDDGFTLHRISIMVTSFTFANIIFLSKGVSLIYPNLLFFGILSNLIFYEKVARPSNPIPQVKIKTRFLLNSVSASTHLCRK